MIKDRMTSGRMNSRHYLELRSQLAKRLAGRQTFQRITIIDDRPLDADVLAGLLRRTLSRDIDIAIAKSMRVLHAGWREQKPDLVFLDDRLDYLGTATTHIPALRKLGYTGPIVIVSGMMTRQRRAEVIGLGAADALHKDDIDAVAMMDLLLRLCAADQS